MQELPLIAMDSEENIWDKKGLNWKDKIEDWTIIQEIVKGAGVAEGYKKWNVHSKRNLTETEVTFKGKCYRMQEMQKNGMYKAK